MTPFEFVVLAIAKAKADAKAKGKDFKGMHTVYTGFNEDFRVLFGQGLEGDALKKLPIEAIKTLVAEGKLEMHYAFGGAMVYLKGEMPVMREKPKSSADVLKKYGMTPPPVIAPKAKVAKTVKAI